MKIIKAPIITQTIKEMCLDIGINLDKETKKALECARAEESKPATRFALDIMIKNAEIAAETLSPVCQDTGMAVVFVDIGQEVHIVDGGIEDAINQGVREAYEEGYFRKSVLSPLTRKNTLDNTPAVIHYNISKGDKLSFAVMAKGFGSENMSKLFMLTPAEGVDGVKKAVIETVRLAGSNPCPPIVVGVGIGGTMEKAAVMSKNALFRNLNSHNEDTELNDLENYLREEINLLGIGAQGLGGKISCLKVFIESFPTHLAGLPVAITIQCHAVRHTKREI